MYKLLKTSDMKDGSIGKMRKVSQILGTRVYIQSKIEEKEKEGEREKRERRLQGWRVRNTLMDRAHFRS